MIVCRDGAKTIGVTCGFQAMQLYMEPLPFYPWYITTSSSDGFADMFMQITVRALMALICAIYTSVMCKCASSIAFKWSDDVMIGLEYCMATTASSLILHSSPGPPAYSFTANHMLMQYNNTRMARHFRVQFTRSVNVLKHMLNALMSINSCLTMRPQPAILHHSCHGQGPWGAI